MTQTNKISYDFIAIHTEVLEKLCSFRLPMTERMIFDTIYRKTFGFQKKEDWIALSQLEKITKLKKQNICRGLSKMITKKIIIKNKGKLSININTSEWSLSPVITRIIITGDNSVITGDNKSLSLVRPTIDTIQKKLIQKKGGAKKTIQTKQSYAELEEVIAKWNKITLSRKCRNSSIRVGDKLLMQCKRSTKEIAKIFKEKRREYSVEEINASINFYALDRANRIVGKDGYAMHKFSFFKFLKQSNGLEEFITLVEKTFNN
ncbi:MAG: replication protein [Candidatus Kariarchaeaceae archaeon]